MRINRVVLAGMLFMVLPFLGGGLSRADDNGFTQKDRELLISLNVKVEEIDKRFEQIDKRFEQIDKRFEQIDKRFEFIQELLVAMLAVFGGLCGVFVGLLLWDRKTFKDKAKEEAVREVEERSNVIKALKKYAEVDPKMADVLRSLGLL